MLIEVHLIQNFAPSNLNRDDTNNPKDCEFGGVRRARISSQCIKRAIRFDPLFAQYTGVATSKRTKRIIDELSKKMQARQVTAAQALSTANEFARNYSSKKDPKKAVDDKERTQVLLFLSEQELDEISSKLAGMLDRPEEIKKFAEDFAKGNKDRPGAPDIALFGRMLADRPETNVDAACQVAHALSTHSVNMDTDYFTAVDDLLPSEETGAGMISVTGFNSACFYRYACIDYDQLVKNLNGDAELAQKTVEGFLRASVHAIPTGKQNSFAAQNPPSFLMAVARTDGQNWSLANAFEKPVYSGGRKSLVQASVEALDSYWCKLTRFYGKTARPVVAYLDGEDALDCLKDDTVTTLDAWVKAVIDALPKE